MGKIKLTTTLALLKQWDACQNGMETLLNHLGEGYPEDKEINLLTILESNGVNHCCWAFRATEQDFQIVKPILISIACDMAESVLHLFENKYPNDDRPRKAIEAARGRNSATAAAADAAAYAAATAAATADAAAAAAAAAYAAATADAAAYAAADAAAAAAADAAAAAAAAAAADADAEKEKLREIIRKYLTF